MDIQAYAFAHPFGSTVTSIDEGFMMALRITIKRLLPEQTIQRVVNLLQNIIAKVEQPSNK